MPIHMCAKFEDIWLSHFQVIVLTKKWFEIRKIKNKLIRHGDELGGLSSSLMIDYNIYYIEKGRSYIDM